MREKEVGSMIENVVQLPLAVGEDLVIQKNRIGSGGKRLCVVTGTHGDELEGHQHHDPGDPPV